MLIPWPSDPDLDICPAFPLIYSRFTGDTSIPWIAIFSSDIKIKMKLSLRFCFNFNQFEEHTCTGIKSCLLHCFLDFNTFKYLFSLSGEYCTVTIEEGLHEKLASNDGNVSFLLYWDETLHLCCLQHKGITLLGVCQSVCTSVFK